MLVSLIYLITLLLIAGVVWWITTLLPLPRSIRLIIDVIFVLIALVIAIDFLLGIAGWQWPLLSSPPVRGAAMAGFYSGTS